MSNKQVFRRCLWRFPRGSLLCIVSLKAAPNKVVRIIQSNSAGDNVHIIDPVTNKVVGEIKGIEVNHGVAVAPDGTESTSVTKRPARSTSPTRRHSR